MRKGKCQYSNGACHIGNKVLFCFCLRGRENFPTGCERFMRKPASLSWGMIRCDSVADSIVWMREDFPLFTPGQGFFYA